MTEALNALVTHRTEVAPGLIILRVATDGWELPDFKPGQYGVLGLPGAASRCAKAEPAAEPPDAAKLIKRAYSIASSSVAKEYLEFYITLVTTGALTPRLFALEVGDRLWLSPQIKGLFTLDRAPADHHLILIATGTGLAPYMSMLRTQLVCGGPRRTAVIHGARNSWDLGYRTELASLAQSCRNFTYLPAVSRPYRETAPWRGATGHVQDVWGTRPFDRVWGFRPRPADTQIFLCGHPGMINEMLRLLEAEGFREHKPRSPGNIHLERYW